MINYDTISEQDFLTMEREFTKGVKHIPRKRFVAKCADGQYLAMDNTNNECWVEKCSSKVLVDEFFCDGLGYDDDTQNFEAINRRKQSYY